MSKPITVDQVLECPGAARAVLELYHGATGIANVTVDSLLQSVAESLTYWHGRQDAMTATALAWEWMQQLGLAWETRLPSLTFAQGFTWSGSRIRAYEKCNGQADQFVKRVAEWLASRPISEEVTK